MRIGLHKLLKLSVLVVLTFSSCTKGIDFVQEGEPVVVVECFLDGSKDKQILHLSFTKQKNEEQYMDLSEAQVTLTDMSSGLTIGRFIHQGDDEWGIDHRPEPGHEYRLDIAVPGYENIWAECKIPQPFVKAHRIDNVGYAAQIGGSDRFDNQGTFLQYYIPDKSLNPDDLPERYRNTNGYCYSLDNPDEDVDLSMSIIVESGVTHEEKTMCIITDMIPVNSSDIMDFKYGEGADLPVVRDLEGEKYYKSCFYPTLLGNNVYRDRIMYDKTVEMYDKFFLLSVHLDDINIVSIPEQQSRLICLYKSKDMNAYQKDVQNLTEEKYGEDITSFFVRDNIRSNINGGIGFFGAEYTETLPWMAVLSIHEESNSNELTPLGYLNSSL